MITEVTGIRRIRMLYVQLLYRCNFRCLHCFHGERLAWRDGYTYEQAAALLGLMRADYDLEAVNFLGGEPFLSEHLPALLAFAKRTLGLRTEICTNGFRITRQLAECAPDIDLLRVSLEGLEEANDRIRHPGSFKAALETFERAADLGIATGATMTVTAANAADVVPLAALLQQRGVGQLKLHCLRPVGNAAARPDLQVVDPVVYELMYRRIADAGLRIEIIADEDLSSAAEGAGCRPAPDTAVLDRIESDPRGNLTMSCKAVGKDAHAFCYDKTLGRIDYHPSALDELTLAVPDVVYSRV